MWIGALPKMSESPQCPYSACPPRLYFGVGGLAPAPCYAAYALFDYRIVKSLE